MKISEKIIIPLSLENSTSFKPKSAKETLDTKNIDIDIRINEEDEKLLKLRDIPRRKSSTNSTTSSKEDYSENLSFPSSPRNLNVQDSNKNGIFFSKDRNCLKNNIFNFYQITEEHIRETFPEFNAYTQTKNYKLKQELYQNNEIPKESQIKDQTFNVPKTHIFDNNNKNNYNTIFNNSNTINNTNYQNVNKITAIPAFIGTYNPNPFNPNRGKFDIPMQYCIGFYPLNGKYFILL